MIGTATILALAACGDRSEVTDPGNETAPIRPDDRPPATVIEAVVARAHGGRRGSFGAILLEVRESRDGPATTIAVELPDRIRVTDPEGRTTVADGESAWTWSGEGSPETASDEQRALLGRWLAALDLICLQPLENAESSQRIAPDRIAFVAHGERLELDYDSTRDATRALLGSRASVQFIELYDSGVTLIPIEVDVAELGRRHLRFLDTGVEFDAGAFRPPAETERETVVVGGPIAADTPRVEATPAVSWLMVPDPGDWPGRMAIYESAGRRLGPRGYGNGGDPMLIEEDQGNWFVVPYRTVRADAEPIEPGEGEQLRDVAAGHAIVIDAATAGFEARVTAARAQIQAFMRTHGLKAAGAPRIAVNLYGLGPAPDANVLRDTPVRVVCPISQ